MPKSRARPLIVLVATSALFVASCGSSGSGATTASGDQASTAPALSGELRVSAAASLTASFDEIAEDFIAEYPDVTYTPSYDSSTRLADQIIEGAPADVFASADEKNVTRLSDEDLVEGEPTVFARNQLIIVTKPGNPLGIKSLADLADAGVVALCAADAPCGKFAAEALGNADVTIDESSVTRGENATATLAQVTEGDAVAGVVYVTDALTAGDKVDSVDIPEAANVIATYPAIVIAGTENSAVAEAFIAYVAGTEGQAVLEEHGFLPPA